MPDYAQAHDSIKKSEVYDTNEGVAGYNESLEKDRRYPTDEGDQVFGDESGHTIKYRQLSWQAVSCLMIAEIVSNGTLSLPSTFAVVGIVPGVILITFLGIFALFTSFLLIQFKLNHPTVHSMGDAGQILFGRIGREILATGTILFAIFGAGSEVLSMQLTLQTLSENAICGWKFGLICACFIFLLSLPRVLNQLAWLAALAVAAILVASFVGMIGAGVTSTPQPIVAAQSASYYEAFLAVTNPTFAYAGHFMFFIIISEMTRPREAFKAAIVLQTVATTIYLTFAIVFYVYYGAGVVSPAFSSLPLKWAKATYGISLPNYWVGGSLYAHTAAKLLFARFFRKSVHMHEHTLVGWVSWVGLCLLSAAIAYILATAVPVFNELVALAASLFAAWFTYGLAGAFWLHDNKGGWRRNPLMSITCWATLIAGAYICVSGCYISIKLIVLSYQTDEVPTPFTC